MGLSRINGGSRKGEKKKEVRLTEKVSLPKSLVKGQQGGNNFQMFMLRLASVARDSNS